MKKLVAVIIAIVMVVTVGAGVALAAGNSTSGTPSYKTAVGVNDVSYTTDSGSWFNIPGLTDMVIKTSNSSALIISLTSESTLITDVNISSSKSTSTSLTGLKVRAVIDNDSTAADNPNVAMPGDVTLNYRMMTLSGSLWGSTTSTAFAGLPDQYIQIYEKTKSANGFNFYIPYISVGSGVHNVTIQGYIDTQSAGYPSADAGVIIGKRSCIIEADRLN